MVYNISAALFLVGTYIIAIHEIKELCSSGLKYLQDAENYVQVSLVGINIVCVVYIVIQNKSLLVADS